MVMRAVRKGVWGACLLGGLVLWGGGARGQTLLFSPEAGAATASGLSGALEDEDLLSYEPGTSLEPRLLIHDQTWETLIGDADGDGTFDDEPSDIDVLWADPEAVDPPGIFGLQVSFTSDRRFASGNLAKDGDVIRLIPGGDFEVVYTEEFFESITATSSIDVDAFADSGTGQILFSFADAEVTTSAALIAQNGGSDTLEDGTVFLYDPEQSEATIFAAEADVLAMVNLALSRSLSTIGDTQGLARDPMEAGQYLFIVSSKTSGVEGTIFSTRGGGIVAEMNGTSLNGDSFGFAEEETLNALCVVGAAPVHPTILVDSPDVPVDQATSVAIQVIHGRPGARVQLLASPAVLPITPMTLDGRLGGTGFFFVDAGSRLFRNTGRSPRFSLTLDAAGSGVLVIQRAMARPGLARLLQVVDRQTLEASYAIVMETIE